MQWTRVKAPGFAANWLNRRAVLKATAAGLVGRAGLSAFDHARGAASPPEPLIVRNERPLDLEAPVGALDSWLTPNEAFFVRSHFGEPAPASARWTVELGGLVDQPLTLSLDDWAGFKAHHVTAVLQCAGNGRAYFRPRIPGIAWEKGAVGQARWEGARLADVLDRAGVKSSAAHIHVLGSDGPPNPKTPPFFRSLPIGKALHPDTILATQMNGGPIPSLHGGPVRLIVPGWAGNHWMKWVRWLTVSEQEAPGFYMQTGYRIPRVPAPPGAILKPSDLIPVSAMNVKSLITWPLENAALKPGRHELRGIAWTGEGHVVKVEAAAGKADAPWRAAKFVDEPAPWSWRRWHCAFDLREAGPIVFRARATDSQGAVQPEESPYNKSGYLWNGIDKISANVS